MPDVEGTDPVHLIVPQLPPVPPFSRLDGPTGSVQYGGSIVPASHADAFVSEGARSDDDDPRFTPRCAPAALTWDRRPLPSVSTLSDSGSLPAVVGEAPGEGGVAGRLQQGLAELIGSSVYQALPQIEREAILGLLRQRFLQHATM